MNRYKIQKQKGFSLIELLVVISIIALLSSIVLVALNSSRQKARDAKRVSDMNQLAKAFELFFNDKHSYPTTPPAISANTWGVLHGSFSGCTSAGCINYILPAYIISKVPEAPLPPDGTCGQHGYAVGTPTQNDYQFLGTGGVNLINRYYLSFCLGGSVGNLGPGLHTLSHAGFQ